MIPDSPGIYLDSLGNVWRKWRDGLFVMLGDWKQRPDQYAPFVRLVPDRPSAPECICYGPGIDSRCQAHEPTQREPGR